MKILKDYPYVVYGNRLTDRMVNAKSASQPWNFVAFTSGTIPQIGPSVRFYGGTATTGITPCAPSLAFDIYGYCEVMVADWMNEENCPNAFDPSFVGKITEFVQENLPVLCLVYAGKLSAADAMDYFTGRDPWEVMLTGLKDIPEDVYLWLQYATTPFELHKRAFDAGVYQKLWAEESAEAFSDKVCPALKSYWRRLRRECAATLCRKARQRSVHAPDGRYESFRLCIRGRSGTENHHRLRHCNPPAVSRHR